ncbi:MAG: N-acetyl-gamma-glutamyl-phosphate reductase [Microthrixaceae bacterium]
MTSSRPEAPGTPTEPGTIPNPAAGPYSTVGSSISVGIVGASGFTGAELMRLLAAHPNLEVAFATGASQAGTAVGELYPSLAASYADLSYVPYEPALADEVALVFCGLPHGASMGLMAELLPRAGKVVDLGADFRLPDAPTYRRWYGEEHAAPELLGEAVFGLTELCRDRVATADLVANPGCYPTGSSLALAPFVRAGLIAPEGIIVDAASGVSGAGRPPKAHTTFCAVDENFAAYGLLDHRHTAEIELATGAEVLLTPHLAPMNRGILATCYARPVGRLTTDEALGVLADAYADDPFIVVSEASPSTKATLGANTVHLTARVDPRTGWLVAISAIDNLVKGASGQAIQNANVMLGLPESAGLPTAGLMP